MKSDMVFGLMLIAMTCGFIGGATYEQRKLQPSVVTVSHTRVISAAEIAEQKTQQELDAREIAGRFGRDLCRKLRLNTETYLATSQWAYAHRFAAEEFLESEYSHVVDEPIMRIVEDQMVKWSNGDDTYEEDKMPSPPDVDKLIQHSRLPWERINTKERHDEASADQRGHTH